MKSSTFGIGLSNNVVVKVPLRAHPPLLAIKDRSSVPALNLPRHRNLTLQEGLADSQLLTKCLLCGRSPITKLK